MGSCFGYSVFTANVEGTRLAPPRRRRATLSGPWTGLRTAAESRSGTAEDIWTDHPADGHRADARPPLVTGPGTNGDPSWSPDGRRARVHERPRAATSRSTLMTSRTGPGTTRLTENTLERREPGLVAGRDARWHSIGASAMRPGACRTSSRWMPTARTRCSSRPTSLDTWSIRLTPGLAAVSPAHSESDYKNGAKFCKAEREFLGEAGFRQKYGGGANAYGKCVSSN